MTSVIDLIAALIPTIGPLVAAVAGVYIAITGKKNNTESKAKLATIEHLGNSQLSAVTGLATVSANTVAASADDARTAAEASRVAAETIANLTPPLVVPPAEFPLKP